MTTLHRSTALALLLPCFWLAPATASVAPIVPVRVATVVLEVADGEGGSLQLDVRVSDGAEADTVGVRVRSCDATGCSAPTGYESTVGPEVVDLDAAAAAGSALLDLAGRIIDVRWEPDPQPGAVVGSTEGSGTGADLAASTYVGEPAVAELTGEGVACHSADAAVGDGVRVTVPEGSSGAARPLSELRLPAGLDCGTAVA